MKKIKYTYITLLAFMAIFLSSCSNILDDERQGSTPATISSGKAKLLLNIGNANSRTIFASDVELSEMTYTLSGSLSNASETTIASGLQYSNEGLKKSDDSEILIDTGNWVFTLTAYKNRTAIYQATANQTITTGSNSISFTLSEIKNASGNGELSITLNNLPVNLLISKVNVEMLTLDEKPTEVTPTTITLSSDKTSITYEENGIENGIYIVRFKFYRGETEIAPGYNELVQIKAERKSSATRNLYDIEEYHSITFKGLDTDDITIQNPIPKSFNGGKTFSLPTKDDIFRLYYGLEGWCENEDCTGDVITQIPSDTTEDKTYWAKWKKNVLEDFHFVINGENFYDGNEISIKKNTRIEVVTTPANLADDEKMIVWSNSLSVTGFSIDSTTGLITLSNQNINGTTTITATSIKNTTLKKTLTVNVLLKELTKEEFRQYCEDNKDDLTLADGAVDGKIYQYVTEFTIPEGYYVIADGSNNTSGVFYGCSKLTSVTIPDSVTSIGNYAFRGCSSLASVTIPVSVTSIGSYAFNGCSSLASVTIPNSVTSIEKIAFDGCSSLESVTIPDSVTSIEYNAFNGCSSLESVTIGNRVTSIKGSAFSKCSSLASVTIPDSVTSIEYYAFCDCSSLTSVTIPDSVTSIDYYAFRSCSKLTSATFTNPNGWWYSSSRSATSGTSISESDLSNPSTAATYLTSTYYSSYWKRN